MRDKAMSVKLILTTCFILGMSGAQAQSSTVEYGLVVNVEAIELSEVDKDQTKLGTAAGGLLGGVIGYGIGKGSTSGKKRRGILGGAVVGGLLGREATKGAKKAYQYVVKLNAGESANITTEQGRIDVGDCVTIERGESANIRRVSQVHCQEKDMQASEEHVAEAKECETAKADMLDAETDEALAAAVEKARLLCEE